VIVIVDPSAELRARLAEAVPEDDVFEVAGLEEARAMLQQSTGRGRIAVLGPGLERSEVLAFAEKAERQRDGTATLLVAQTLEPGLLREAMRSGVDDILTVNASADEWAEAVARTRGRIRRSMISGPVRQMQATVAAWCPFSPPRVAAGNHWWPPTSPCSLRNA
jgi:DNA-binding NarL/FixJ family response regulator